MQKFPRPDSDSEAGTKRDEPSGEVRPEDMGDAPLADVPPVQLAQSAESDQAEAQDKRLVRGSDPEAAFGYAAATDQEDEGGDSGSGRSFFAA